MYDKNVIRKCVFQNNLFFFNSEIMEFFSWKKYQEISVCLQIDVFKYFFFLKFSLQTQMSYLS